MNTDLPLLSNALKVFRVLNKIKVEILNSGSAVHMTMIIMTVNQSMRHIFLRHFVRVLVLMSGEIFLYMYMLVKCTEELIPDQNLTEVALMQHSASMM
jgi:hypothetical protein